MKNIENTIAPSIIHFIWVGGTLPQKYLKTIMEVASVAKKSGFQLNLWVDDVKNFEKSLANLSFQNKAMKYEVHMDLAITAENVGITLRYINELLPQMEKDPFYQQDNRLRDFADYVRREAVGFKNLGAVSDLLRYEILRQEGGVYFDTDTLFHFEKDPLTNEIRSYLDQIKKIKESETIPVDSKSHLTTMVLEIIARGLYEIEQNPFYQQDNSFRDLLDYIRQEIASFNTPAGTLDVSSCEFLRQEGDVCCDTKVSFDFEKGLSFKPQVLPLGIKGSVFFEDGCMIYLNDVIAAMPQHPVLEGMIVDIINNYRSLLRPEAKWGGEMETKRFKVASTDDDIAFLYQPSKVSLTIKYTGPGVVTRVIPKFFEEYKRLGSVSEIYSLSKLGKRKHQSQVCDVTVTSQSDKTWIVSEDKKQISFDDSRLLRPKFFSNPKQQDKPEESTLTNENTALCTVKTF